MHYASLRIAIGIAILLAAQFALAAEKPPAPKSKRASEQFLRLTRDKDKSPLALETSIVRHAAAAEQHSAVTVDLVAAIHIGEKSYYEQLNRDFENYDAVLYELVAPEESRKPRPGDSGGNHPISLLQNGMKDILGLEFQLKAIDYTRKNMIHADMSPDEFAKAMEKRGESTMTMLARMFGYALARQSESADGNGNSQLLLALFDKNRSLALKRVLAEEFANSEDATAAIEGPTGSTLISGRNQVALEVLRKEIAAGKRKIAIFYGAAHMPDLQARLRTEFGFTPVGASWLEAWTLKR